MVDYGRPRRRSAPARLDKAGKRPLNLQPSSPAEGCRFTARGGARAVGAGHDATKRLQDVLGTGRSTGNRPTAAADSPRPGGESDAQVSPRLSRATCVLCTGLVLEPASAVQLSEVNRSLLKPPKARVGGSNPAGRAILLFPPKALGSPYFFLPQVILNAANSRGHWVSAMSLKVQPGNLAPTTWARFGHQKLRRALHKILKL